jgi:universal stress protein A
MQLYKHILVTIDCSSVDSVVIDHIAKLALMNASDVTLLHVVHAHTLDQSRFLRELAEEKLQSYASKLNAQGTRTSVIIRSGEPEIEILAEIESSDFDLIAMATHGHSLLSSFIYGSVSRQLKQKTTIPMLLIGQPPR